jgi:hypothetical protein
MLAHETNESLEPIELSTWRERNLNVLLHLRVPGPKPPFTYKLPHDRMVPLGGQTPRHGEGAEQNFGGQVIETEFLRIRLE